MTLPEPALTFTPPAGHGADGADSPCGTEGPPPPLWMRRRKGSLSSLTVQTEAELSAPVIDGIREAYDFQKILGKGSVGTVHLAERRSDGLKVVVKMRNVIDKEVARSCRQEFEVLQQMRHPHIITALDFLEQNGEAALIFEYCCDQTLHSIVKQSYPGGLPSRCLQPLSRQLCEAVDYLHSRRIVHRDIKPDNILLSDSLQKVWLADFNTAYQLLDGWALTMTGTIDFSAPEVLHDESPSEKADIWSLGVSLHFMAVGKLPRRLGDFLGDLSAFAAACSQPVTLGGPEWQNIDEQFKCFIKRCLAVEKAMRPASMMLLQSPFFEKEDSAVDLPVCRTSSI